MCQNVVARKLEPHPFREGYGGVSKNLFVDLPGSFTETICFLLHS